MREKAYIVNLFRVKLITNFYFLSMGPMDKVVKDAKWINQVYVLTQG